MKSSSASADTPSSSADQFSSQGLAAPVGTTTTLTVSPATAITLGDTIAFTATVSGSAPTGLVAFFDGSTPLATGTLNTNFQAAFPTSLLSAGNHSISAIYDGDGNNSGSVSSITSVTVSQRGTTTGVVLSPAAVVVGQPSTATVTVTDSGSVPPGTPDIFATPSATPVTGRTGFTATLIADGQVLILDGTDSGGNTLQSAEIYNASKGIFVPTTNNPNAARTGATATLLPNGQVLIAGGNDQNGNTLNTAELFDPSTQTFSNVASAMRSKRFGATATLLNSGKVLIAGGNNGNGAVSTGELFDPSKGTFTSTGNSMSHTRIGATATLLNNGKVLIAGGINVNNTILNNADLFNPASGTFAAVPSTLSDFRLQPQAALLLSGKVLIAGGQNPNGPVTSADLYDPVANSFTASASSMSTARANGSAVTLPNGMVLLAGGTTSKTAELYDADSDVFDTTGSLLQSENGLTSTLLNNGQILVVGLTAGNLADAELYTPSFHPLGTVAVTSSDTTDSINGTCTLTPSASRASTCSSTITPFNVDTNPHVITGNYPADLVHSSSAGNTNLTVNKTTTSTVILANAPNPSAVNQPVTVSVLVTAVAPGAGTPTGNVTISDGKGETCTATLDNTGVGSCSLTPIAPGVDSLTAVYNGDLNFNASTSAPVSQTVVAPPTIAKAFGASSVPLNGTTTVTFTITNPAANPTAENGIVFTDTLTNGLQVAATPGITNTCNGTVTANAATTNIKLSRGNIPTPGGTCTVTVNVTGTLPGTVLNTTSPVSSTSGGTGVTSNTATLTVVAPPAISKAFGASSIPLNGTTTVTFTLTNPAANTTTENGIAFSDTLTNGLQVAATPGVSNTCGGTLTANAAATSISLSGGSIATPGGTCTVVANVTGTLAGTVSNTTGAVSSTNGGTGAASNTAILFVVVPPTISKAFVASSIPLNGTTTVTFTITNPTANTTTENGIAFSDTLTNGLQVAATPGVSNSCGGTVAANAAATSISLSGGSITALGGTCTVAVNVTGTLPGTVSNTTGPVTSTNGGTGVASNTVTLTVVAPPSIAKVFNPATIPLNGTSTLTFTITNPAVNAAAESGVTFTDTLPTGLVVATPNGLANTCNGTAATGSTSISLSGGSIAVNSSCTLVVNVTGTTSGQFTNVTGAVISTNGGTGNTATANLTVLAPPSIAKAFSATHIPVFRSLPTAATLTFTITNSNTANPLNGLAFTDNLPAGLAVAATPNIANTCGGTVTAKGGTITLSGGTVNQNANCSVAADVQGITDGVQNNTTGNVTATDAGGLTGNTAAASITVINPPSIAKAFAANTPIPHGAISGLTFTITNSNANLSLNGVAFADSLPLGQAVAAPSSGLSNTCGGTAAAAAGSSSITLSGVTLAPGATCTVSLNVQGTNTATNSVTVTSTDNGGLTGNTATATLNVGKADTLTSVTSSQNPSFFSVPLTFTATVSAAPPGTGTPTGTVTFLDGGTTTLGSATMSNGVATFSPNPSLAIGNHTITASYGGDLSFNSSQGSLTGNPQVITAISTSSTIALTSLSAFLGQSLIFQATVSNTAIGSTATPTGSMQLLMDGTSFGSPVTVTPATSTTGNAQLTVNLANVATGSHLFTVNFQPSTTFAPSTSTAAIAITVAPSTVVNNPGQPISVPLQINSMAVAAPIAFNCTVQALGSPVPPTPPFNFPLCSLDISSTQTLPVKVTATINTVASKASMAPSEPSIPASRRRVAGWYALSTSLAGVLGIVALGGSRRRRWSRRNLLRLLSAALVLFILMVAIGCGGGFANPNNQQPAINGNTQSGAYVVSVIGTDANKNTVAIATISLFVQP